MSAPNLYTFPLVPYPGPAPETAPRNGMGGWETYAQPLPADRLAPFVLARAVEVDGSRWVNCARIEHALTGALLATLVPTGTNPGPLGLLLEKYAGPANTAEFFAYTGAVIPGLAAIIPCGTPCRLVLDNAWQGPAFVGTPSLPAAALLLEWSHPGGLAGVPYGAGMAQRLYVLGAALTYTEPRTERTVSKDPDTGAERVDFDASWARRTVSTEPLPAYLAEALAETTKHDYFTADGQPWRVVAVKASPAGLDGGRDAVALTLEGLTPSIRRACPGATPLVLAYNPATDTPRPWRCGDASDTAADYQPTGAYSCQVDTYGNTGNATVATIDANPYSATAGLAGTRTETDTVRCPVPPTYYSVRIQGFTTRNNCPAGQGPADQVYYDLPAASDSSRISQADADTKAQARYATQAQANANTSGTCATTTGGGPVQWQPIYAASGCFSCQMENKYDHTDVRVATTAESDLYYRQYDNSGGTCSIC